MIEQPDTTSRRVGRVVAPVVLGLLTLALWAVVAATAGLPKTLLPPPADVFHRFVADLQNGLLLPRTLTTAREAVLGCLLAAVVALPTGYLVARSRIADAALSPYLAASQAIPAVALAPLLVIWVGYGLFPIVLLCALIVFFPVVLSTSLGVRTLDKDVIEAALLDGATGLKLMRHIEIPLALPAILTGLRNGFTLSITGAVVGELVMGGEGLGMILSSQANSVDTTGVFSTLVMLCLLAVVVYLVMVVLERALDPFKPVRRPTPHPEGSR